METPRARWAPLPPARLVARGAGGNPANRFEPLHYAEAPEADPLPEDEDAPRPLETRYFRDPSRTLLAQNTSPDVGFDTSLNPYRGCVHGCVYCFARPTHEYLGLSAGLDFESKIFVKEDAPALLRKAFAARRWTPRVVALGVVTDAYQPIEQRVGITRRCLEVFAEFRNPVAIVTKSQLVTRDGDLLRDLASDDAAVVNVSLTTLDDDLRRVMEPRASSPRARLAAVETLAEAGVPVGVMLAPIIPGLTDEEIPSLVRAAADAGARWASPIVLRLPHGVADLFDEWLERHFPERRGKVLSRLRDLRGGRLNDPRFHSRMKGEGPFAEQIRALFDLSCRRAGLPQDRPALSTAAFRRPADPQLSLFQV